jgi:hypothetical protein
MAVLLDAKFPSERVFVQFVLPNVSSLKSSPQVYYWSRVFGLRTRVSKLTTRSVVKTLGFNRTITLVLTCPPFLLAGVAGIMTGWSSGRLHERTWHITGGLFVAIVGFVIAASTMNTAGRYIACFIFPVGAYSVNSVIIGWASSTLSQTKEKKAVVLAMTNVGGQVSS